MKKIFLIVILSFICGFSLEKTMMVEIISSNRPAEIYDIRVANFAKFFGDSLFIHNDGKIFLFYESLRSNRLYVANAENPSDFFVYQLPLVNDIPWINPQRYMSSRFKTYEAEKKRKGCLIKYVSSDSLMNQLVDLHLDRRSTIEHYTEMEHGHSFYGEVEINPLVLGFSQSNGVKRFFFHRKLSSNALEDHRQRVDIRESLEKYNHEVFKWNNKVFSILNKLESKITFEDCI